MATEAKQQARPQRPRPLTDRELLDFERREACQKSWWAKSLLLTIAELRANADERECSLRMELGGAKASLKWFEETYGTRAFAPLIGRRLKGTKCPHCGKLGVSKIGKNHACLECQQTWEQP